MIKEAKKVIRDAFNKDDGFKDTYIANVAMAIFDRLPEKTTHIGGKTKHEFVNDCAKEILTIIFYK
jgi:hypothetical protein